VVTKTTSDSFSEDPAVMPVAGPLVVDLEGYEGPLDVLLALARTQKVDLTRLSILQLAEQYLAFIAAARRIRLELAADYLVMAAWLVYLKSRLLLPDESEDEEPTGAEMAARLAFQLRRLEAMREAGANILSRDRLGREIFARGTPENIRIIRNSVFDLSLYELLKGYAASKVRGHAKPLTIEDRVIFSIEDAVARLTRLLGLMPSWQALESYLPESLRSEFERRSALAATFSASLELARTGMLRLRQGEAFGPIYIRAGEGRTRPAREGAAS
jgi:segregation and condensation protein A